MKIVCKQDNCLNEKLVGFGNLIPSEYQDNETSVYDEFIDSQKFKDDHYSVALTFKENWQIADNYQLCLNRLQKLKEQFSITLELLNEYNNKVFDEYLNYRES